MVNWGYVGGYYAYAGAIIGSALILVYGYARKFLRDR